MPEILAADIGGTNCRFAHFRTGTGGTLELVGVQWLKTAEAASFGELLQMLGRTELKLKSWDADIAIVAAAGPVAAGERISPPFISWDIDLKRDGGVFRSLRLINDFVAQAFATRSPVGEGAEQLLSGRADPAGTVAVIGAGTGLGMAALVPDGAGGFCAMPSEGGHSGFQFVGKRECEFSERLARQLGASYLTGNEVVSGPGLSRIHHYLSGEELEPHEVTASLAKHPETHEWAARFYGRACRNLALHTFSTGGLYIAGGVAARAPEIVRHRAFHDEFKSSPRMSAVLAEIPVYLISEQDSGLWGAAYFGLTALGRVK